MTKTEEHAAKMAVKFPEIQPEITRQVVKRHQLLLAMEFGFKQAEKGNNLDKAFIEFNKLLNGKE